MNTSGITNAAPSNNKLATKSGLGLKAQDFIKMMVTQLQNQDPLQPAKNEELLAQMSQIGQLETSTQMQDSLKSMMLQSQIGSASSLIGKSISGMDDQKENVSGVVNSVRVIDGAVNLELDNGKTLPMGNVTEIAPTPASDAPVKIAA